MSAQFSRYIWATDPEDVKQDKLNLRNILRLYDANHVSVESVVHYLTGLAKKYQDFSSYLMLGRAILLSGKSLDSWFLEDLMKTIRAECGSFSTNEWEDSLNMLLLGVRSQEEFLVELCNLNPVLIPYLIRRTSGRFWLPSIQNGSDIRDGGEIYYANPLSGFFSMVENILLADFVAKINNKRLCLIKIHGWNLPVSLEDIIRALGLEADIVDMVSADVHVLGITEIRNFFYKNGGPVVIDMLLVHKHKAYGNLRNYISSNFLHDLPHGVDASKSSLIYVRRGDKIDLEDIPLNYIDLENFIEANIYIKSNILIISDDYYWAEGFKSFSKFPVANLTFFESAGSVGFSPDSANLKALLSNFYYLTEFCFSYGTATSNLVNAAFLYRKVSGVQVQSPSACFITPLYSHI